ncbi:MAG TPA: sensor histidine kinase, partial [Segetibacter sp.]
MNRKLLTITVHVAVWACFFLVPVVFFPRSKDPNFQYSDAMIGMFICIDVYLIAFYYFNRAVLIPKLLTKRKWFWYIVAIIVCLILFLCIRKLFEEPIRLDTPNSGRHKMSNKRQHFFLYPFTGFSAVFFLVLTVSTCTKVIQEWLGIERKRQEVETEKLATELSFLKSQINPHFLFNTLNNIYSLAMVKSDATADAVLKLSSIMRYVLNETKNDIVPLEKEIQFVKHFIELQKVRLTDKVSIDFNIEDEIATKQIAPLILIAFVENAFKYGISTKESSKIYFSLVANSDSINFIAQNDIMGVKKEVEENTGIGLTNTKRRLELLYPQKH